MNNSDWDDKYLKESVIGKGTYGEVYKAKDKNNPKNVVAIKKLKLDNKSEGIPATTLREIAILSSMDHPNVLKFKNIKFYSSKILLCLEFFPFDLRKFIQVNKSNEKFDNTAITNIFYQILKGVNYLHSKRIIHRDLKTHNILINPEDNKVQIADFGLSRVFNIPVRPYTKEICKF